MLKILFFQFGQKYKKKFETVKNVFNGKTIKNIIKYPFFFLNKIFFNTFIESKMLYSQTFHK